LVIAAILAVAGAAGAYLTQAISPLAAPNPAGSAAPAAPSGADAPSAAAGPLDPGRTPDPTGPSAPPAGPPPEAPTRWARRLGPSLGIPVTALRAYGYATLRVDADQPGCHLAWTTLAAIGKVESDHGRTGGATLQPDGRAVPPIIGPALNGQNGLKSIPD